MTDTLNPTPRQPAADDRFSTIGTNVLTADSRPVGAIAGEPRERLPRLDFIKVDRKGFLRSDAYFAADEIDRVQDGAVHLTVTDKEALKEAGT